MALNYASPGVYVEEVPAAAKPIAGVGTSTPAFIAVIPDSVHLVAGYGDVDKEAGKPRVDANDRPYSKMVAFTVQATVKKAYFCTNFAQFAEKFGGLLGDPESPAVVTVPPAPPATVNAEQRNLAHAVYGFFNNGGSSCYVMRVAAITDLTSGLEGFAAIDDIALVAAPGRTDKVTYTALVDHCAAAGDRFAILDGPSLDGPSPPSVDTLIGQGPDNTDLAAWYVPWIKVFDPATKLRNEEPNGLRAVPPSGHVAGIYARVDTNVGVHKAPANEVVRGAIDVTRAIGKADQAKLNPVGINCIRGLNGNVLVWGARTAGGDANADLKYVNVRRTLLFLRESIDEGMQFVVFQPNTPALWAKIVRNVGAFLTNVWRAGALFGSTPEEAFYVKCDAELNPPSIRDLGQVVTEIGVAIVRPAEFVIFRLSQSTAPG